MMNNKSLGFSCLKVYEYIYFEISLDLAKISYILFGNVIDIFMPTYSITN